MSDNNDSYLSLPVMTGKRRRLFTFTNPILFSHDGSLVATAAEGVEDDQPRDGMRFLILDALWDGRAMKAIDPIGVWVNTTVIATEQLSKIDTCWCGCGSRQHHQEASEE